MMTTNGDPRGQWASSAGFVLAAAGSAIGLGNLWRFPYITGENGGGLFVLIYLFFIAAVGIPILLAEILIGRAAARSPVGAMRELAGPRSPWVGIGGLSVTAATLLLSVYAVAAGWGMHYAYLGATGRLKGLGPQEVGALFREVNASAGINLFWAVLFMALTVGIVVGGVHKGIERASQILMPALLLMLLALLGKALTLDGFGEAFGFVFGLHADRLTPAGVLEALGHAFFTLGVGGGVMLTYGSYLGRDADIVKDGLWIAGLDTLIALLACLVIFPITFTFGLPSAEGPGLVFTSLPVAFAQMPAGSALATFFFALFTFAALTSSISMLEIPTAYLIDQWGWSRRRATLASGGLITLLVVPAALTGASALLGEGMQRVVGKNWFDLVIDTVADLMLPVGGLGFAIFVAWRLGEVKRRAQFPPGIASAAYLGWLMVLRWFVPLAVGAVFLHAIGLI